MTFPAALARAPSRRAGSRRSQSSGPRSTRGQLRPWPAPSRSLRKAAVGPSGHPLSKLRYELSAGRSANVHDERGRGTTVGGCRRVVLLPCPGRVLFCPAAPSSPLPPRPAGRAHGAAGRAILAGRRLADLSGLRCTSSGTRAPWETGERLFATPRSWQAARKARRGGAPLRPVPEAGWQGGRAERFAARATASGPAGHGPGGEGLSAPDEGGMK